MENKVIYKDRKNTHSKKWDGCLRLNLATKPENIRLAADRIIQAFENKERVSEDE